MFQTDFYRAQKFNRFIYNMLPLVTEAHDYTAVSASYHVPHPNNTDQNRTTIRKHILVTQCSQKVDGHILTSDHSAVEGPVHKVRSIIMSLNFRSSQLARISLAEFVSKLILIA